MATPTRSDSSPDDDPWTVLFDQFNRTVRSESESLLKHIVDSQTNLLNERNCLRSEIESLRKEKKELAEMCKQYGQVVTLNVGGQMFSSTLETLTEEPCLFTKMFSGRHELPEHQGAVFVDRDPTHFRYPGAAGATVHSFFALRVLLNYLRTRTFIEPKSPEIRAELRLEAEYYQIASLVRHLAYQSDPTTVAERLFFGVDLHHPAVSIAADMLQASYRGPCAKFIYAGVANLAWHSGRHYWEVIFEGNKSNCASLQEHFAIGVFRLLCVRGCGYVLVESEETTGQRLLQLDDENLRWRD